MIEGGELQAPITREEMVIAQVADTFCRVVLARRVAEGLEGSEPSDGLLVKGGDGEEKERILDPESMGARLLNITHRAKLAGHP